MTPDWTALEQKFAPASVRYLRDLYATPGSLSLTAEALAKETKIPSVEASRLLEEPTLGLQRREYTHCSRCGERLEGIGASDECPHCHTAFVDTPAEERTRFELYREPPRDVPWVLVLHGMNTSGTWQEELSWLISRSYGRMVPVAIYKYGIVRPGVLFRSRQKTLSRTVAAKIKKLSGDAAGAGYGGRPDVIAHSFGTWLVANALLADPEIQIGRLILLGCIVRPDFDWKQLVAKRQVSHILNHGASCDIWVRISQFAIPSSGPGAIRGFAPPVMNTISEGLAHSDYFDPESRMRGFFEEIWRPFLSWTTPRLEGQVSPRTWQPLPAIVRLATRALTITLLFALVAFVSLALILGTLAIVNWF